MRVEKNGIDNRVECGFNRHIDRRSNIGILPH